MWCLTLCVVAFPLALEPARLPANDDEERAIAGVTQFGGQVTRDDRAAGKPVTGVKLRQRRVTAADLKELAVFTRLTTLSLSDSQIADEDLKWLGGFKHLASLDLKREEVTDRTLAALRHVGLLHTLSSATTRDGSRPAGPEDVAALTLQGTKVTSECLKELTVLKNLLSLELGFMDKRDFRAEDLKTLAAFGRLTTLRLHPSQITDRLLMVLREGNQLHTLSIVRYGSKRPTKPAEATSVDLSGTEVTATGLKELATLTKLTEVKLRPNALNWGLKELSAFKGLTSLELIGTHVTDEGMKEVGALKTITNLRLTLTAVTGAGLKELAPLKDLSRLELSSDNVTDQALAALRKIGKLHALHLATADNRKRPAEPDDVVTVNLMHTKVTPEGLKELAEFKNLTTVNLTPFEVNDEVLAVLCKLDLLRVLPQATVNGERPTKTQKVTHLDLSLTKVSDVGLMELIGFKNLKELKLQGTKTTSAGVKALRKALPGCRVDSIMP